jgi:halimadienyl-diphosphate synthase
MKALKSMKTAPLLSTHFNEGQISKLLQSLLLGNTRVSSTAYDTAWAARLSLAYPNQGFEQAVEWLRKNQHFDGSWGSPVFHYHDRIVSTLAAIVALSAIGTEDQDRVKAGQRFIWQNFNRLHYDAHDTIGFPVVIITLINQAQTLGLDIPPYLYKDAEKIEKKLNMLSHDADKWRYTTLHYSMEAILQYLPEGLYLDFGDELGCVGCSPASTVATLLDDRTSATRSLAYLNDLMKSQADRGVPTVDRIDIFEAAWTLNNLRHLEWISPEHPNVRPILEFLWEAWSDTKGVGHSRYFNVADLDDTAAAFSVLRWGGYPASADAFARFETETHFKCYDGELDMSMSAQVRALSALQFAKEHPQYAAWTEKLEKILRIADLHGSLWFDKWHASPYYLAASGIWLLHEVANDLVESPLNWLLKTQNNDGGWGFYQSSTIEETSYALQALLYWDKHVSKIDNSVILAGGTFLETALKTLDIVPMWIGKALYTPYRVVQSSILVTISNLQDYREKEGNDYAH